MVGTGACPRPQPCCKHRVCPGLSFEGFHHHQPCRFVGLEPEHSSHHLNTYPGSVWACAFSTGRNSVDHQRCNNNNNNKNNNINNNNNNNINNINNHYPWVGAGRWTTVPGQGRNQQSSLFEVRWARNETRLVRTAPYFDAFFLCIIFVASYIFNYIYFSVVQKCLPKMIWQFPGF